ncbi:SDR family NAD(P)-dependent oxidoreductase [Caballeronia calidae]|uniref:SDR family NAD(P)-dependent oxidoreductase n=1 Tax=Caballeronia calidae TaxID=1777139 RepID=UPI000ABF55BA|nr:SDR family NAD(P)-dependent oxidoreductase [Caballeronia calidae]
MDEVIRRAGRLNVLVNNAGMMQEQLVEELSLEDWTRNLTANLPIPVDKSRAAASA